MPHHVPQLPFFVYGSLLPGQMNAHVWADAVVFQELATLAHGRLYSLGDYPILIENGGGPVKGMVMTAHPRTYAALLARLDALEAYNPAEPDAGDYERVIREARLTDGAARSRFGPAVLAWVYIGPTNFAPHLPLVPDGDWLAYTAARGVDGQLLKRLRD